MMNRKGFTIVELLIVIVVIAILAAISVVAYRGIQDRAQASQFNAAFDIYEKALTSYYTLNGSYPMSDNPEISGSTALHHSCIGKGYVATTDFALNECAYQVDGESGEDPEVVTVDTAVSEAFATVISPVATVSQSTTLSLSQYGQHVRYRGLHYTVLHTKNTYQDSWFASMSYYTPGDQACGRGKKYVYPEGTIIPGKELTVCSVSYQDGIKVFN